MDWYIAELAPGATRPAIRRGARAGDSVVEDALYTAGFDVYLPRLRKEVVDSRSRRMVVRAFPLFTGYAFVGTNAAAPRFKQMRDAKGVLRILGTGSELEGLAEHVAAFREAERDMVFDDTREARIRRKQEGRTRVETIRMQFKPGSRAHIVHGPFAGFHGQVRDVLGKGIVEVMVELFGRLTRIEAEVGTLQPAA